MTEHRRGSTSPAPAPYDVVVGHGVLGRAAGAARATASQRVARAAPAALARPVTRRATSPAGLRGRSPSSCPTARRPRPPRSPPTAGRRSAQAGFTRSDAVVERRRRRHHRPGRLRRRDLAARRARSCTCRPRCSAWSTRPSAARPASTPPRARTSSAPSTRRPACSATSTCSRPLPRHDCVSGLGRGHQVRLHRRPGDPRPGRDGPGRPRSTRLGRAPPSWSSASIRVKAEVVAGDLRETGGADGHPGREVLNYGHTLGARDREGRAATRPARRGGRRSGWSSSPSWPGSPAGSTTRPPTGTAPCWRRSGCRTTWSRRAVRRAAGDHAGGQEGPRRHAALRRPRRAGQARGPRRTRPSELLRAAYAEIGRRDA